MFVVHKTFLLRNAIKVRSGALLYSIDISKQKVDKLAFKKQRLEVLKHIEKYPHKFKETINTKQLVNKFKDLEISDKSEEHLSVCGMVSNVRDMSKKLKFVDIEGSGVKVQLKISAKSYNSFEDFVLDTKFISRGDRIGKAGF